MKAKAADIGGLTAYYGATMSWKASDNIRFYGHIAREKGDHYTQDYSVSLGMKYSF